MFRITEDPSLGVLVQRLAKNYKIIIIPTVSVDPGSKLDQKYSRRRESKIT